MSTQLLTGFDLGTWPEWLAFAKRLGIGPGLQRVEVIIDCNDAVRVVEHRLAQDHSEDAPRSQDP